MNRTMLRARVGWKEEKGEGAQYQTEAPERKGSRAARGSAADTADGETIENRESDAGKKDNGHTIPEGSARRREGQKQGK